MVSDKSIGTLKKMSFDSSRGKASQLRNAVLPLVQRSIRNFQSERATTINDTASSTITLQDGTTANTIEHLVGGVLYASNNSTIVLPNFAVLSNALENVGYNIGSIANIHVVANTVSTGTVAVTVGTNNVSGGGALFLGNTFGVNGTISMYYANSSNIVVYF